MNPLKALYNAGSYVTEQILTYAPEIAGIVLISSGISRGIEFPPENTMQIPFQIPFGIAFYMVGRISVNKLSKNRLSDKFNVQLTQEREKIGELTKKVEALESKLKSLD